MLRLIAFRDFLEFWRDGRLPLVGGLVAVLLLTAFAVGWQHHRSVESERRAAQALDYEDWLKQGERHPHDAAHQGMHVFKIEPPLSIVDPGITPYVGSTIWLQAHRQSELRFRPAQDATGLQRFGNLSVAWVLQVLGPLLVIVLGFNAFAGEREQGTLRQILGLGVPPLQLLWGKALALAASVALLLVPVAVTAAFIIGFTPNAGLHVDALARLAWVVIGYGLYFGITIFVVLAVSAIASSSRVALIGLLALWIVGAMLAPRAASDIARDVFPSPSRMEFNSTLDAYLDVEYERVWRERFGMDKRWSSDLPLNRWGIALRIDDQAGYGVVDRHFADLWRSFTRQQRAQEWVGLAVPLLALRAFSMGMSGTDFVYHQDFSTAAERHRRLIQDLVSDDLVKHADPLGNRHFAYQAGHELWARVPGFSYTPPGVADALLANWVSLVVLMAGLVIALALALWAVRIRKP